MSLKLNGATSGYVEIDAPAVAGSTSITLPATSGGEFVVTDSNGDVNIDSGTFFVDASTNRVGIGTTTVDDPLHLYRENADALLRIENTGNGNHSGIVFVREQSGGTGKVGANIHIESNTGGSGTALVFGCGSNTSRTGSERMRIDSDGRLLVGATTDSYATTAIFQGNSSSSTSAAVVRVISGGNDPTDGEAIGRLGFGDNSRISVAEIRGVRDGGTWTTGSSMPSRIAFMTCASGSASPLERVRITRNGYLKATSDNYVNGGGDFHEFTSSSNGNYLAYFEHSSGSDPYGLRIQFSADAPNNNTNTFINCADSTTARFIVYSDGDVRNHDNFYGGISDEKLKQNIVDAGSQWDDLKNLRVRKFKFKSDVDAYGDDANTLIGLVAQEAELVSPGLIRESPDVDEENNDLGTTTKSVAYSVLYMKAVKALQEAMERIETLEAKVAALEAN